MMQEGSDGWKMIRLLLSIGIATVLWPVDENNNAVGISGSAVTAGDLLSAGYSVIDDASHFCVRNAATCETASAIAISTASKLLSTDSNSEKPTDEVAETQVSLTSQ